MPTWDPGDYLTYADERSRPFLDLVARVPGQPRSIVDLGCGPGHLSAVLRRRWPDADILGIDSSVQMVEQAVRDNDDEHTAYELADLTRWKPAAPVDLVISNAALQWVPDQLAVIERLRDQLAPGGTLAFQVPHNFDEPSHGLLREISAREPYAAYTEGLHRTGGVGPETYLDRLGEPGWRLDVWETTYFHVLSGEDPVFAWIRGTGARPVLQALPDELRARFEDEYRAALRDAYPVRSYGTVLPFPRVFAVAVREAR